MNLIYIPLLTLKVCKPQASNINLKLYKINMFELTEK